MAVKKTRVARPSARPAGTAAVLTISDSCARGERRDLSGPAVVKLLRSRDFIIVETQIVADDRKAIEGALTRCSEKVAFVVTTGGTGISPTDVTPEATRAVCDRILDGVSERMRSEGAKKTRFAALSRSVCGVRGSTLILNLPGSPTGATESLAAVLDLVPHALQLLQGVNQHP